MKLSEVKTSWKDGTTEGYLAVLDPEGNWTPEAIWAFKSENAADAKACKAEMDRLTKGTDTEVKLVKVDDFIIVMTYDHRADMDEVHPIGFEHSKSDLEERLQQEVEDGEINIDAEMLEDLVEYQFVQFSGKP